jgi:hypothetical protein
MKLDSKPERAIIFPLIMYSCFISVSRSVFEKNRFNEHYVLIIREIKSETNQVFLRVITTINNKTNKIRNYDLK